ncbi:MAG: acyl carrier protein [Alphaproteobacteria bacterium]|nr:acyl carrier protein [Alphaproteobacteria bacterium]
MMTSEDAYSQVVAYLTDVFEIPAADIRPDARLMEDLDLDSIDAVDLMVKLQETTGQKVTPEQFETIRTVQDLVTLVQALHTGK